MKIIAFSVFIATFFIVAFAYVSLLITLLLLSFEIKFYFFVISEDDNVVSNQNETASTDPLDKKAFLVNYLHKYAKLSDNIPIAILIL